MSAPAPAPPGEAPRSVGERRVDPGSRADDKHVRITRCVSDRGVTLTPSTYTWAREGAGAHAAARMPIGPRSAPSSSRQRPLPRREPDREGRRAAVRAHEDSDIASPVPSYPLVVRCYAEGVDRQISISEALAPPGGWVGFSKSRELEALVGEMLHRWPYVGPTSHCSVWESPRTNALFYLSFTKDQTVDECVVSRDGEERDDDLEALCDRLRNELGVRTVEE